MRKARLWWIGVALVLAVIGYAWIDGGREPVSEIAVPIAVPAEAQ